MIHKIKSEKFILAKFKRDPQNANDDECGIPIIMVGNHPKYNGFWQRLDWGELKVALAQGYTVIIQPDKYLSESHKENCNVVKPIKLSENSGRFIDAFLKEL